VTFAPLERTRIDAYVAGGEPVRQGRRLRDPERARRRGSRGSRAATPVSWVCRSTKRPPSCTGRAPREGRRRGAHERERRPCTSADRPRRQHAARRVAPATPPRPRSGPRTTGPPGNASPPGAAARSTRATASCCCSITPPTRSATRSTTTARSPRSTRGCAPAPASTSAR
jgi:hypothetical protein